MNRHEVIFRVFAEVDFRAFALACRRAAVVITRLGRRIEHAEHCPPPLRIDGAAYARRRKARTRRNR